MRFLVVILSVGVGVLRVDDCEIKHSREDYVVMSVFNSFHLGSSSIIPDHVVFTRVATCSISIKALT